MRCYTVDEAVNRVGYDQVYELVANAVASQVLVRPLVTYGVEADQLWHMSIACALAAEALAERNHIDCDIAYTVGLLHGVGLVAIDEWAFRQHPDLRFSGGELPLETCEVERATLGFHNAEAGASLLRLWEFPAVMSEPVRWQYLPRGTAAHFQLAAVLHVAKWIRTRVCQTAHAPRKPEAGLLRALNLSPEQLEAQAESVHDRMDQVRSLLETDSAEKAILTFPNGQREIAGPAVSRSLMNRYA
jgi:HD-like signal output (HDOD) protein